MTRCPVCGSPDIINFQKGDYYCPRCGEEFFDFDEEEETFEGDEQ